MARKKFSINKIERQNNTEIHKWFNEIRCLKTNISLSSQNYLNLIWSTSCSPLLIFILWMTIIPNEHVKVIKFLCLYESDQWWELKNKLHRYLSSKETWLDFLFFIFDIREYQTSLCTSQLFSQDIFFTLLHLIASVTRSILNPK